MDSDQGDGLVEEVDDIEKPTRDFLSDDDGDVFVLGKSTTLIIPVLQGSDDVAFVSGSELDLDLVARVGHRIEKKNVQPPGSRLASFNILQIKIAEAEQVYIGRDLLLKPLLIELRVSFQTDALGLPVLHPNPYSW